MNILDSIDKNKIALLQGRLGVPATPPDNSQNQNQNLNEFEAQNQTQTQAQPSGAAIQSPKLEVNTSINTSDAAPEVIDICDMSDPGSTEKSKEKSGVVDWPKSLLRYEEHSNSNHSKHARDNEDGKKDNTPKRQKQDGVDPSPDGNNSRGAITGMRKLETYFQSNGPSTFPTSNKALASSKVISVSSSATVTGAGSVAHLSTSQSTNSSTTSGTQSVTALSSSSSTNTSAYISSHSSSVSSSQQKEKAAAAIAAMTADFKKQNDQLRLVKDQHEQKAQRLEAEMRSSIDRMRQSEERNYKLALSLEEVYRTMALQEARRKRDRLAQDNVRLGKIQTVRTSATSVGDVWEEGYALKELNIRTAEVSERREELEKRKKRMQQTKRKHNSKQSAGADNNMENNAFYDSSMASDGSYDSVTELEIIAEESAYRSHMEQLKRDESALLEARHLLDAEKAAHQKEFKRCQSEDKSRFFRDLPCLNKRYLLLSMLGRGGFSEVWKALDLLELREVAVKIHQLNPTWSEARKQSYVKHVTREYTIHRDLNHPRVVLLFDVFEIDINSFATVLELCRGTDLDEKLKTQKTIPEKDAKTILMQIMLGLRYLNAGSQQAVPGVKSFDEGGTAEKPGSPGAMPPPAIIPRRRSIIHFDLKPANILFDSMGDVKITDFGLSKILDEADEGMTSVELTSQGAGTYWYLPPECFDRGDAPPRISSKVDVWSLGVILYQMLFGKRPFGEGKSQERVLSEGIMLNATRVDFPQEGSKSSPSAVPRVSDEAKDFIRACLTWDQRHRPDVLQLCQHPYLRSQTKKS